MLRGRSTTWYYYYVAIALAMVIMVCALPTSFAQDPALIFISAIPANIEEKFGALNVAGTIDCSGVHRVCAPTSSYYLNIELSVAPEMCSYPVDAKPLYAKMEFFDSSSGENVSTQILSLAPLSASGAEVVTKFTTKVKLTFSSPNVKFDEELRWDLILHTDPEVRKCSVTYPTFVYTTTLEKIPEVDTDAPETVEVDTLKIPTLPNISTSTIAQPSVEVAMVSVGTTAYQHPMGKYGQIVATVSDIDTTLVKLNTFPHEYTIALVPTGIYQSANLEVLFPEFQCRIFDEQYTEALKVKTIKSTNTQYWELPLSVLTEDKIDFSVFNLQQLLLNCRFRLEEEEDVTILKNLSRMPSNMGFQFVFPNTEQDGCADWTIAFSDCAYTTFSSPYRFKTYTTFMPLQEAKANKNWASLSPLVESKAYAYRLKPIEDSQDPDVVNESAFRYIYNYHEVALDTDEKEVKPTKLSELMFGLEFVSADGHHLSSAKYSIQCQAKIREGMYDITFLEGELTVPQNADTIVHAPFIYENAQPKTNFWSMIPVPDLEQYNDKPFGDFPLEEVSCQGHYRLVLDLVFRNSEIPVTTLKTPSLFVYLGNDQYNDRVTKDYTDVFYSVYSLYPPQFEEFPPQTEPNDQVDVECAFNPGHKFTSVRYSIDTTAFLTPAHSVIIEMSGDVLEQFTFHLHDTTEMPETIPVVIGDVEYTAKVTKNSVLTITDVVINPGYQAVAINFPHLMVLRKKGVDITIRPVLTISIVEWGIERPDVIPTPEADEDYNDDPVPQPDPVTTYSFYDDVHGVVVASFAVDTSIITTPATTFSVYFTDDSKDQFVFKNHGSALPFQTTVALIGASQTPATGTFTNGVLTFTGLSIPLNNPKLTIMFESMIILLAKAGVPSVTPRLVIKFPEWQVEHVSEIKEPTTDQDYHDEVEPVTKVNSYIDDKVGIVTFSYSIDSTLYGTEASSGSIELNPAEDVRFFHHGDKKDAQITKTEIVVAGKQSIMTCTANKCDFSNAVIPANTAAILIEFPHLIVLRNKNTALKDFPTLTFSIKEWDIKEDASIEKPWAEADVEPDNDDKKDGGMSGVAIFFIVVLVLAIIAGLGYFGYTYYVKHLQRRHFQPHTGSAQYDPTQYGAFEMAE